MQEGASGDHASVFTLDARVLSKGVLLPGQRSRVAPWNFFSRNALNLAAGEGLLGLLADVFGFVEFA
jgi:hypothetical protein